MTKPIRATRDNLLPGTIWQNAAGTEAFRCSTGGGSRVQISRIGNSGRGLVSNIRTADLLKSDIWYKVQPIKEPTE